MDDLWECGSKLVLRQVRSLHLNHDSFCECKGEWGWGLGAGDLVRMGPHDEYLGLGGVTGDGGEPELEARVLVAQPGVPEEEVDGPVGEEELVRVVVHRLAREVPYAVVQRLLLPVPVHRFFRWSRLTLRRRQTLPSLPTDGARTVQSCISIPSVTSAAVVPSERCSADRSAFTSLDLGSHSSPVCVWEG